MKRNPNLKSSKPTNYFILAIFILHGFFANAQDNDWCGTISEENTTFDALWAQVNQNVPMESFAAEEKYVFKVHFWDIAFDNGDNPDALSQTQMLDVVANLNRDFNGTNIFFKFDGKGVINATDHRDITVHPATNDFTEFQNLLNFAELEGYYKAGSINMYSPSTLNGAAGIQTFQDQFFGAIIAEHSDYNVNQNVLFSHEVGHFFFLRHTFHFNAGDPIITKENVARLGEPDFNADLYGDKVIDTYATPAWYEGRPDCIYDDILVDQVGRPYSDYPPQPDNYMSYAHGCQYQFTAGQVLRMRMFIEIWNHHPQVTIFNSHPISILYEPYAGEYYNAGPQTPNHHPLFQYGFTYKFVDVSQADIYNQPSSYETTDFWSGQTVIQYAESYNQPIEHENHTAIIIKELEEMQPRMCYNNYNRAPNAGTLIEFLDGVPNGNYILTPQDSLEINSPTYIEDLNPGLYDILKNYEDGTTQETMILIENN